MSKNAIVLGAVLLVACQSKSPPATDPVTTTSSAAPTVSGTAAPPSATVSAATSAAPSAPQTKVVSPAVATSTNALATDLYGQLAKRSGSLFFSPISVGIALAMAEAGAKGATRAALDKVLRSAGPIDALAYGSLIGALSSAAPGPSLRIANRFYADRSLSIEPTFLGITHDAFGAPIELVDFVHKTEDARVAINGWVAEQTNDTIKELIAKNVLNPATRLALVDAIYFKGSWATPFPKNATKDAPFHGTAGTKNVPTMHAELTIKRGVARTYEVAELPYSDPTMATSLVMDLILPRPVSNVAAVEAAIAEGGLDAIAKSLTFAELTALSLPRTKLTSGFELVPTLTTLGLGVAFGDEADFTGIAKPGADKLRISNVIHQAFVQIDETGTEAAAATAVVGADGMGAAPKPKPFVVDRPFLFLVRDARSGVILFVGRVTDPS